MAIGCVAQIRAPFRNDAVTIEWAAWVGLRARRMQCSEAVGGPFPYVARHCIKAAAVGGIAFRRGGTHKPVICGVDVWEAALPYV